MIYRLLADVVVIAHLLFVLFALLGGLTVLWRRWMAIAHVPALTWAALVELNSWICPLTPLEQALRRAGGAAGYSGGFIDHYLLPILYPPGLTPALQILLGVAVLACNAVVYGVVVWQRRRGR